MLEDKKDILKIILAPAKKIGKLCTGNVVAQHVEVTE
jgi:hypothetical protein